MKEMNIKKQKLQNSLFKSLFDTPLYKIHDFCDHKRFWKIILYSLQSFLQVSLTFKDHWSINHYIF